MNSPHACTRRSFIALTSLAAVGTAIPGRTAEATKTRMKTCLSPGSIGVSASQDQAIELAAKFGFDAVEPYAQHLAGLSAAQMDELLARLKVKNLAWGAAGLPVEFRRDDAAFRASLEKLPALAAGLQRAGVTRVGTWLTPSSGTLTYVRNFRRHAERLRAVAKVLADHGQRLGLEYVGTFTSRANARFPFIHNLAETRELIAEIGTGNVGVVLDSWHWWQADDTVTDLLALKPEDVVSVDLNDAPAGVPKREQQDGRRELPAATGVIDVAVFLRALQRIGCDGPVRAEPFNKALNDLDNEAACAATIAALKKALATAV
jgi:sugar phosphate isomerase/epimerase